MTKHLLAALAVLPALGCPNPDDAALRIGADATLQGLGLVEYIQAAYEEQTKTPSKIVYGSTIELQKLAETGKLDYAFVVSEDTMEEFKKEGLPIRAQTYAHEELVFIGPWDNMLGSHNYGNAKDMMKNISRSNYRYLRAKIGSVEWARHKRLFRIGGDRGEPGSFFSTKVEGVDFVKEVIERNAFGLVKRSAVLQSVIEGKLPHRLYKEADPDLVLRLVIVEIHPGKTKRKRSPGLYDLIMGGKGRSLIERFGANKFGYPMFAPGEPPEGEGAGVPGLKKKKGLIREEPKDKKDEDKKAEVKKPEAKPKAP